MSALPQTSVASAVSAPPTRPQYAPQPRKVYPAYQITKAVTSAQDISALLASAQPNTLIKIADGITATVKASPIILAPNVGIAGGIGSKIVDVDAQAGIIVRGEGFNASNIQVGGKGSTFFRIQAPWCHFSKVCNFEQVNYLAILDGPGEANVCPGGADHFTAEDCGQLVRTGADFIYTNGADNVSILRPSIMGSVGEQGLRFDQDSKGHAPQNWAVIGGVIHGNSPLQKSCISAREGWGTVNGVTLYGYIRGGQQSGDPKSVCVNINGNTFHPDSSQINNVDVKAGTAWIDGNTFYLPQWQRPVGSMYGQGQILSLNGNTKVAQPHGCPVKKLWIATEYLASGDVYHEDDGVGTKCL